MKKIHLKIIGFLLFTITSSCMSEEIDELFKYEDYFIEITALLDQNEEGEKFDYHISYIETDGLNNLVETNNAGYYSTISKQPLSFADKIVNGYAPYFSSTSIELVKKHKKIGVILKPIKNIISFNVIISDIYTPAKHILDIDIELAKNKLIKVIYDFDSELHTIEYLDE